MQDNHLFEYAVIRIVPRVEREEFLNVGIVVFCKKAKFLQCRFHIDGARLAALSKELDVEELKRYLEGFEKICAGRADGGPIARLDLPERFRWLTATRSTIIQVSKVHPGFCGDMEAAADKLFQQLVL